MADAPLRISERRYRYARAIWDAMVNDEVPDDATLDREGFTDAADAVIRLADQERSDG